MSCISTDALSHFEQREQELLALNRQLEQKREQAIADASSAVRGAEATSQREPRSRPPTAPQQNSPPEAGSRPPTAPQQHSPSVETASPARAASPHRTASPAASRRPASGDASADPRDATIKFQNARILAMSEESERLAAQLSGQAGEAQQLRQELKQAQEECRRLQKTQSSGEQTHDKARKQATASEARVRELEEERAEMVKARDQLELQRRKSEQDASAKDVRLNRLAEECERYKTQLRDVSNQGRDKNASDRRETDKLTVEVRKLERQRTELVNAFKKQMKLIDVLKRQRAHVEAARVLSFTEEEFIRILELGNKLEG